MTFRLEYAEQSLLKLIQHVRKQLTEEKLYFHDLLERGTVFRWETNIHVASFWHFNIYYELSKSFERIEITHKNRNGHIIFFENGKITKHFGIRRFDMLFAALNDELISKLKNRKVFKITKKKMDERYLTKTPYFWAKIEYYLQKKEDQKALFELFEDQEYNIREKRIEKAIEYYIEDKRNFIENTKKNVLNV